MSSATLSPARSIRRGQRLDRGFGGQGQPQTPDRAALPTVSVVIPAKNEAQNIGWVLSRLPAELDEVILVDSSDDGTAEVAASQRADLIVVDDPGCGKGAALRAGFAAASGDYIVMLDADCSMDPAEIDRFVGGLLGGFDMVKGSRSIKGGGSADLSPLRRAGNRVLTSFVNVLYGVSFTDLCYGFFAFRRDCLPTLAVCATGFEIETELVVCAINSGLHTAEVPSFEEARRHGESNLNTFRDGTRVLRTLIAKRFARTATRGKPPAGRGAPTNLAFFAPEAAPQPA